MKAQTDRQAWHDDPCDDMAAHVAARIVLRQDRDAESPREDAESNLGVFVDWHRRAKVGDRKLTPAEREAMDAGGFEALAELVKREHGATVVLPVCLLDHSGWHVYIGTGAHACDPGGWDSGMVGFIYDDGDRRREFGTPDDRVDACLRGEIAELDQHFGGDRWGFEVIAADGETVLDACWGFYGTQWRENGMAEHWTDDVIALAKAGKIQEQV